MPVHVLASKETFAADALAGIADVYGDYVVAVDGGLVRATPTPAGKVAVVVGGGSGHYPAFAGLVGAGLADAAVVGDVFASPSTRQVVAVSIAASREGGVLFVYGNYAGDRLNFSAGAARLVDLGIAVESVVVTDDVASAPVTESDRRRGVAGDLIVIKCAGAAAEAGYDLAGVTRVARTANERTRSFGVAFAGCTLPGADAALFELPRGMMGVGLGVHGEPGIGERPIPAAAELSALLVDRLLEERPAASPPRVAALLNGLGTTKYEELFGLWSHMTEVLRRAGLEVVAPAVGEYVTSLDMAGCSLTLCFLDEELERLWVAPAASPAFHRQATSSSQRVHPIAAEPTTEEPFARGSGPSRNGARWIARSLRAAQHALVEAEGLLGGLDAQAGDGDHGRGMVRGVNAALLAATEASRIGAGASTTLRSAADAWADLGGGTSGALWGVALRAWAGAYSDIRPIDAGTTADGARAAVEALIAVGGARLGDKSILDALDPFVEVLTDSIADGQPLGDAWHRASMVAVSAAERTAALRPRIGRARTLAERSVGHRDAGAVSMGICADAVDRALASSQHQIQAQKPD